MRLKLRSIWKLIFAKGYYVYFTDTNERSINNLSILDVEMIKKDCQDIIEEQAQIYINIEFVKSLV